MNSDLNATELQDGKFFTAVQNISQVQFWHKEILNEEILGMAYAGYRRCWDFDQRNTFGQDSVRIEILENIVVAVVADGVSTGFNGNIAAEVVCSSVFNYLIHYCKAVPNGEMFQKVLPYLKQLIHEEVQKYQPSVDLTDFEKELMAERKENLPSQAVFSAFVYDIKQQTVDCYAVGDADIYIHRKSSELANGLEYVNIEEDARMEGITVGRVETNPNGRITSKGESEPYFVYQHYDNVVAVAVQSDGMIPRWGAWLGGMSNEEELKEKLDGEAWRDDISFAAALSSEIVNIRKGNSLYPAGQAETIRVKPDHTHSTSHAMFNIPIPATLSTSSMVKQASKTFAPPVGPKIESRDIQNLPANPPTPTQSVAVVNTSGGDLDSSSDSTNATEPYIKLEMPDEPVRNVSSAQNFPIKTNMQASVRMETPIKRGNTVRPPIAQLQQKPITYSLSSPSDPDRQLSQAKCQNNNTEVEVIEGIIKIRANDIKSADLLEWINILGKNGNSLRKEDIQSIELKKDSSYSSGDFNFISDMKYIFEYIRNYSLVSAYSPVLYIRMKTGPDYRFTIEVHHDNYPHMI